MNRTPGQEEKTSIINRVLRSNKALSLIVFVLAFTVYNSNGDFLPGNDAKGTLYLPISLLKDGNLSFRPDEFPFMFIWQLTINGKTEIVQVESLESIYKGIPLGELYNNGALVPVQAKYYITGTIYDNIYVNRFGPGPAILAFPIFALLSGIIDDVGIDAEMIWYTGKFLSSFFVALSVVLIFLCAILYTSKIRALLLCLVYGFGTCVWSISSQTLWQHAPNVFFISLGMYLLTQDRKGYLYTVLSSLSFSIAFACRPTSLIFLVVVGLFVLRSNIRKFIIYTVASLPVILLVASYNYYYFDSPFLFGQNIGIEDLVYLKTGSTFAWQTTIWEGGAGLLFSTSRGLFVFSPIVIFAIPGFIMAWRNRQYEVMKPLLVSAVLLFMVASRWYDWWGGWSYGYRQIVDIMPIVVLMFIPTLDWLLRGQYLRILFAILLIWSISVQFIGAYSYDVSGWNNKLGSYVVALPDIERPVTVNDKKEAERLISQESGRIVDVVYYDIDKPEYRGRLWSLSDSQILYYFGNYSSARKNKNNMMDEWIKNPCH
jgi:hypothetical protein